MAIFPSFFLCFWAFFFFSFIVLSFHFTLNFTFMSLYFEVHSNVICIWSFIIISGKMCWNHTWLYKKHCSFPYSFFFSFRLVLYFEVFMLLLYFMWQKLLSLLTSYSCQAIFTKIAHLKPIIFFISSRVIWMLEMFYGVTNRLKNQLRGTDFLCLRLSPSISWVVDMLFGYM